MRCEGPPVPTVSVDQAAKLLRVRPATIWGRIRRGELAGHRQADDGSWLVDVSEAEIAEAATRAQDPTVEALAALVEDLQEEIALLTRELGAYRDEAGELAGLRRALDQTLRELRSRNGEDTGDAAPAAPPLEPAAAEPNAERTAEPSADVSRPDSPRSAAGLTFPSDVIDAQAIEEARRAQAPPLEIEPPAEPVAVEPTPADEAPPDESLEEPPGGAPPEPPDETTRAGPASTFVDLGLRLHYLEWGERGNPPIVLLHGLTGNDHQFDSLAQQLAGWFHLFAIDLRGHGESQWDPEHGYRISAFVQDLNRFIDTLDLIGVSLIGTALGGDIALAYAGARPAVVDRLVINDTGPELNRAGEERMRHYIQESPTQFVDMDAAIEWWREHYPVLRDYDGEIVREFVGYNVREQADGSVAWRFDEVLRRVDPAQWRDVDLFASARLVECPTLIVRGSESDILSSVVAARLRDAIKGAQLIEVPGVGHAPSLIEPEVLGALRRFLGQPQPA